MYWSPVLAVLTAVGITAAVDFFVSVEVGIIVAIPVGLLSGIFWALVIE